MPTSKSDNKVAEAPQTFLTADLSSKELALWTRRPERVAFDLRKVYGIAIGAAGYRTPKGAYVINTRVKDPDWMVPDSDWARDAGLEPGTVIDGGSEQNPLKARWLGVTAPSQGVGIHGTANDASIGAAESHGCLRMHVADVVELYDRVPRGTIIYITR